MVFFTCKWLYVTDGTTSCALLLPQNHLLLSGATKVFCLFEVVNRKHRPPEYHANLISLTFMPKFR